MAEVPQARGRARRFVGALLRVLLVSTAPGCGSHAKSVSLPPPKPGPPSVVSQGPVERKYSCDNFLGAWAGEWQETAGGSANAVCYRIEKSSPLLFSVTERSPAHTDPGGRILPTLYPATCEEDGTLTYATARGQTEMKIVHGTLALEATQLETHARFAQGTMRKGSCPLPE